MDSRGVGHSQEDERRKQEQHCDWQATQKDATIDLSAAYEDGYQER